MSDNTQSPNLIRVAVTAAGGPKTVGEKLGASHWSVNDWCRRNSVPGPLVKPLAELSGGLVSTERLAGYIAEQASKRASARARATLGEAA